MKGCSFFFFSFSLPTLITIERERDDEYNATQQHTRDKCQCRKAHWASHQPRPRLPRLGHLVERYNVVFVFCNIHWHMGEETHLRDLTLSLCSLLKKSLCEQIECLFPRDSSIELSVSIYIAARGYALERDTTTNRSHQTRKHNAVVLWACCLKSTELGLPLIAICTFGTWTMSECV